MHSGNLVLLVAMGFSIVSTGLTSAEVPSNAFSVRDSIELTRFNEPNARDSHPRPNYSPDGRWLVTLTTRGIISTNEVQSTLSVFDLAQVKKFLMAKSMTAAPLPRALVNVRGMIRADQPDSYGSQISSITWSPDSKTIHYLRENDLGLRQLFEIGAVTKGRAKSLTPRDQNVESFNASGGTVAYIADAPTPSVSPPGMPINAAASDITGQELMPMLAPKEATSQEYAALPGLWAIYKGKTVQIRDERTGLPLVSSRYKTVAPIVSPDGQRIVALLPVTKYPAQWKFYKPAYTGLNFIPKPVTPENEKDAFWPVQYAIVDLKSGHISRPIDAPSGWAKGYSDIPGAAWSADGKDILVINTFLPITDRDVAGGSPKLTPCAVALVRVVDYYAECILKAQNGPGGENRLAVMGVSFGESDDDVVVHRRWYTGYAIEHYRYRQGKWTLSSSAAQDSSPFAVSINLRQSLNVPPALWASDKLGNKKLLWNPSPGLSPASAGEASVFRWRDNTGYEWIGGLIKPAHYIAGRRYPLIVQSHGFHNENEFITDGAYTTAFAAREFAAAGFVVLEVRDRKDGALSSAEAANMMRGYETAVQQLDSEGLIDPERVGIIGFSRTCYYVESALIHSPLSYAAASIADGIDESYVESIIFDVDQSLSEGKMIYGSAPFGSGLQKWVDAAPGFHLSQISAPLMVTAITPRSLLLEWETYSSLWQQKKPVDFVYIPNGQHILQNPLDRLASQQSNVDWFRFWLEGYEDPDAAKTVQYRRWERLCDMQIAEKSGHPTRCVPTSH